MKEIVIFLIQNTGSKKREGSSSIGEDAEYLFCQLCCLKIVQCPCRQEGGRACGQEAKDSSGLILYMLKQTGFRNPVLCPASTISLSLSRVQITICAQLDTNFTRHEA